MSSTAVVQLQQRDVFERNVTRSLLAGAGAGAVAWLTTRLQVPVPLSFLAIAAMGLACVRGDKLDRLMLMGASVLLPALPWLFGLTQGLVGHARPSMARSSTRPSSAGSIGLIRMAKG